MTTPLSLPFSLSISRPPFLALASQKSIRWPMFIRRAMASTGKVPKESTSVALEEAEES